MQGTIEEMPNTLMTSWENIAKRFDIVLLDTCAIGGHSNGKTTLLGHLYDKASSEESIKGLQSHGNRHSVVKDIANAYGNICTIPEVSQELDKLLLNFKRYFKHLIKAPSEVKEEFPDFGERVRTLRGIIKYLTEIKKLTERHSVSDENYERFADLYYEISKLIANDVGLTDNRLSARAIYENLNGKKAAIITDDRGLRYLIEASYPVLLGMAPETALETLQKNYTEIYMPGRDSRLNYELAFSTTRLGRSGVPKEVAVYAEKMKELMGRIVG